MTRFRVMRGQTFIHELVHACQIQHSKMDVGLLADAFASKVCEATGSDPYEYGPARPYFRYITDNVRVGRF